MSKRSSRRNRNRQRKPIRTDAPASTPNAPDPFGHGGDSEDAYRRAAELARQGKFEQAHPAYAALIKTAAPPRLLALVENDIGAVAAVMGNVVEARSQFRRAIAIDALCEVARENLLLIGDDDGPASAATTKSPVNLSHFEIAPSPRTRVAIVSMLFNWPSTGGGTVHTAETGKFLSRAGYHVKHFYAQYAGWGVGNVTLPLDHPSEALTFAEADWHAPEIQRRFREAVDRFAPDYVIITDSWNFKPLLAEAVRGYRYFLRLAAQECLCPLNNVRLLVDDRGQFSACPRNQLATPQVCRQCVSQNQNQSGSLHQAERALSGYGTAEYDEILRRAFAEAEGILAVNPLIAATVSPFAKAVHVVPSGFDAERFPWPWPEEPNGSPKTKATIFFAGLVDECMKGFHVLHAACAKLWQKRQDFELVVTSDPPGQRDAMTRCISWLSQSELPRHLRRADFLVFPTIAEEALGRSAVEAMGVGRPVIASRIGGLPFTVTEGLTGLLFEPGNVDELAAQIETLLDDPGLRERMGAAARQQFVERFTWDAIIDAHYRKLLKPIEPKPAPSMQANGTPESAIERGDSDQLIHEMAEFFGMARSDVERMSSTYRSMRERQFQAMQCGGPSLAQGFLICLLLSIGRPAAIVVAGTRSDSTDAIQPFRDLKSLVALDCQIIRYDGHEAEVIADANAAPDFADDNATTAPSSEFGLTSSFQADILDRYAGGLIWLAAGATFAAQEIVTVTCRHFGQWMLAVEPNPRREGDPSDIAAQIGASGLGFVGTPTDQTNSTHRLKVFESAGRLALLVPKSLAAPAHSP